MTYISGGSASTTATSYVTGGSSSTTATSFITTGNSTPLSLGSVTGTIAVTEEDDSSAITGEAPPTGSIAATEADDTSAITGQIINVGTIAVTEADDTSVINAAAIYDITGAMDATEADDTLSSVSWVSVTGTLITDEEGDFVDANEDFFGIVTLNVVEKLSTRNRYSRLQIPPVPADIPPAARRYLETTFRYIQDEFNRLGAFQFEAIDLVGDQIAAQQELIANIIPLVPVTPDVPPPTLPPWNPNPVTPIYNDGGFTYFTVPPPNCTGGGGYLEYELQRQNLSNPIWETIYTSTTTTGGVIGIPDSNFSTTYTYRLRWRSVCNGVPGAWTNGDPFLIPDTWGVCPDDPLNYTNDPDIADIVAYVPYICPPTSVEELVSGSVAAIGPGYGGGLVGVNWHLILGNPDTDGVAASGLAPAANGINYPRRLRVMGVAPAGMDDFERFVFRVGPLSVGFNRSNGDVVPFAAVSTSDGTKLAQTTTNMSQGTTQRLFEAIIDGTTLTVYLDGIPQASVSLGGATVTQQTPATWALVLPALGAARDGIAYKTAEITPDETLTYTGTEAGVQTTGTYGNVRVVASGKVFYFAGAYTDPEVAGGSIGVYHTGMRFRLGTGAWQHIEAVGGPYTEEQPGNEYTFVFDAGGEKISFRISDSIYTDNTGSFNIDVYDLD